MARGVEKSVLTVGLKEKAQWLTCLPIDVVGAQDGSEAIAWLRKQLIINALVSLWDLPDMKDGALIRRVKAARLWLPTVVLMDEPYQAREAAARALGVSSVMSTQVKAQVLQRTIAELLGLSIATVIADASTFDVPQPQTHPARQSTFSTSTDPSFAVPPDPAALVSPTDDKQSPG